MDDPDSPPARLDPNQLKKYLQNLLGSRISDLDLNHEPLHFGQHQS